MKVIVRNALSELGWNDALEESLHTLRLEHADGWLGRVKRIDRGWSTLLCVPMRDRMAATEVTQSRVRNLGRDVAVGDWLVIPDDGERITEMVPRYSRLVRRASSDGVRNESQTIAANVDAVLLVHSVDVPVNVRRLERELVLAFDSGARPVLVLSKSDTVTDAVVAERLRECAAIAVGVPIHVVSSLTGAGLDELRDYSKGCATVVVLGASGVGKSTLVNALTGSQSQLTGEIRDADKRGRHTTTAVDLVPLPNVGWLIDTPGLRAVNLWTSGHGIERAFTDVFALAEHCKFRDCKHESEPSCAVQGAIIAGQLDPRRVESMRHLVAEEAELEREQLRAEQSANRRRSQS